MLPKTHRFHGYNSLRYVYGKGQTVRGPLFSVKAALNPKRKSYRVAVVVSRKVNKSAVVRNRIRRRLYQTVRQIGGIDKSFDIVLTVFSDKILEQAPEQLTLQVEHQLSAAGVLAE